jgi:tRNA(Ile)-lysidine synthase
MIKEVEKNVKALPDNINHWIVAYSGGVDSCVLADILYKIKPSHIKLSILHVNHGLGQDDAVNWAKQAKDTAKKMNAEFLTTEFNMDETETGLEEKARDLRYSFIEKNVGKNSVVFMGHHKNDQTETFLFRLFRGTGIKGLTAIPMKREIGSGILFRPMLTISRKEIVEYANSNNIHWFEDDTNVDTQFSRNFIRHDVIPLLSSRWPKLIDQISSMTKKAQESYDLSVEIAEQDLNFISTKYKNYNDAIDCSKLHSLSELRQKNVISYIFDKKLGISQESKNFNNTLNVLLVKTNDYSKVRKLPLKNCTIFNNGKFIWFEMV